MATNTNTFPAYFALFKATFRQMFWSRRTVLILLGCLLSLVIALAFRFMGRGSGSINRFIPLITLSLYGLLMNLSAIFYGTAIISDEIDGKGLTYLQMRPLQKSTLLLSKFARILRRHYCDYCRISPDSDWYYDNTPETTEWCAFSLGYEFAIHRLNGIGIVSLRGTRCGLGSQIQESGIMGVAICDGMGTDYIKSDDANRNQADLYIALSLCPISALQAAPKRFQ